MYILVSVHKKLEYPNAIVDPSDIHRVKLANAASVLSGNVTAYSAAEKRN